MARLLIVSGPREGDYVNCCSLPVCCCNFWGHLVAGSTIKDGFTETLIYRRIRDKLIPHRTHRETCIVKNTCPKCERPMPPRTENCLNCGTDMDPLGWNEDTENV